MFQYVPSDSELAAKGKRGCDCRFALESPVGANLAFLRPGVSWVCRVDLHAAPFAAGEGALCRDDHSIERVEVPKMPPYHPSVG